MENAEDEWEGDERVMLWRPDLRIMEIRYVLDGRRTEVRFRGGMFRGLCDIKVMDQDENEKSLIMGFRDIKIEYATSNLWQQIKEVAKVNWIKLKITLSKKLTKMSGERK